MTIATFNFLHSFLLVNAFSLSSFYCSYCLRMWYLCSENANYEQLHANNSISRGDTVAERNFGQICFRVNWYFAEQNECSSLHKDSGTSISDTEAIK